MSANKKERIALVFDLRHEFTRWRELSTVELLEEVKRRIPGAPITREDCRPDLVDRELMLELLVMDHAQKLI